VPLRDDKAAAIVREGHRGHEPVIIQQPYKVPNVTLPNPDNEAVTLKQGDGLTLSITTATGKYLSIGRK
jgi:hypothetical protein